jgi:hypothetical protein
MLFCPLGVNVTNGRNLMLGGCSVSLVSLTLIGRKKELNGDEG